MTARASGWTARWAAALLGLTGCGLSRPMDIVVGEDYPKGGTGSDSSSSGDFSPGGEAAVGIGGDDGDQAVGAAAAGGFVAGGGGGSTGAGAMDGAPGAAGGGGSFFSGGTGGTGGTDGSAGFAAGTGGTTVSGSGAAPGGGDGTPVVAACAKPDMASEEGAAVGLAGDFDDDGNVDLATANNDGTVTIFRGDGTGCLVSKATFATELGADQTWWDFPPMLVAADVDKDGTPDLVTANPDAAAVSVLLGETGGSFAPPKKYEFAASVIGLAVVDWDGDGNKDIVVVTNGSENEAAVILLTGYGIGTFGPTAPLWSGFFSGGLDVDDLNHDGRPDVILGGTTILLQHPDGTLVQTGATGSVDDMSSVSVADLDGDENLDIVSVDQCNKGAPENCIVWHGRGDGTFEQRQVLACGCSRHEPIATAAVTRDGPVALVRFADTVYLGAGNGTFSSEAVGQSSSSEYASLLAAGDWNHDQLLDIAVVSAGSVAVRLGSGDGRFSPSTSR